MFYPLAKFFGFLLTLPNAAIFAVALATSLLWTGARRTARTLVSLTAILLVVLSFSPLAFILLRPLEDRFPRPVLTDAPTGLIVLGGIADEVTTRARNTVTLTDGAERLTEAVALSRRFPNMRLVFTGGPAGRGPGAASEADVARRFWTEMGVAADRITLEDRSRDTWENGIFTKALLQPKPGELWLLVTSAAHMPRAVGIFRKIGFAVVPYPVDYHTTGNGADFKGLRGAADTGDAWAIASHEWIGLVAYYLAGKSSAICFPDLNPRAAGRAGSRRESCRGRPACPCDR